VCWSVRKAWVEGFFFLTKGCKELSGGSHNWVIFGRCRVSAQLFFLSRGGEHGGPRRDAHRRQRRRICRKRSGRLLHGRGEARPDAGIRWSSSPFDSHRLRKSMRVNRSRANRRWPLSTCTERSRSGRATPPAPCSWSDVSCKPRGNMRVVAVNLSQARPDGLEPHVQNRPLSS
jgi:hypothetical protein